MIKDYDGTPAVAVRAYLNEGFDQPGDPIKGAQKIVDLLRGDWQIPNGVNKIPGRLALGDDAFGTVKEMYGSRLKQNEEWKDWICGNDCD
jgi:hypothetical protein